MFRVAVYWFIVSVIYSRIYTGRHSLDQCIVGFAVGVWTSHFCMFYWREHVFDFENKRESNHYKHAKHFVFVIGLFMLGTFALYYYIEWYVHIPDQWYANAKLICSTAVADTRMFHNSAVTGVGTLSFVLVYYLMKAYRHR